MTYFSAQLTFFCPAGWAEKIFRTSQLGNKGFSAHWAEKQGFSSLKMEAKNEFFVSVAGNNYFGSVREKTIFLQQHHAL